MKKRLLLLDVALVGLIVLAGVRLRSMGQALTAREEAMRRGAPARVVVRPEAPIAKVTPLVASEYAEVAQKMLFVPDRNPNVIVEAAPVKVMPPLPVAHGTMELGGVMMALLSEKPAMPHRAYMAGDTIGAFKLLIISRDELTLEWEGKKITRRLAELMEARARAGSSGAAAQNGAPAAAAASPAPTTITNATPAQPGIQLDSDVRACQPGDNAPDGTVSDGYKKVMQKTPFGNMCRWQAIK
ncbi:MAG: hypothetical protein LLG20_05320 [Acidobacteriales bacterium]|nr:hypothetical protein [Terriglobales bacterium]